MDNQWENFLFISLLPLWTLEYHYSWIARVRVEWLQCVWKVRGSKWRQWLIWWEQCSFYFILHLFSADKKEKDNFKIQLTTIFCCLLLNYLDPLTNMFLFFRPFLCIHNIHVLWVISRSHGSLVDCWSKSRFNPWPILCSVSFPFFQIFFCKFFLKKVLWCEFLRWFAFEKFPSILLKI